MDLGDEVTFETVRGSHTGVSVVRASLMVHRGISNQNKGWRNGVGYRHLAGQNPFVSSTVAHTVGHYVLAGLTRVHGVIRSQLGS